MYYLSDVCSLCLSFNKNVSSQSSTDLFIQEILECIFPKYISSISKQICQECLDDLDSISKFRQKCLENIHTYNEYIQKLKQKNKNYKCLSVSLIDIERRVCEIFNDELNSDKNAEEPDLKIELDIELFDTVHHNSQTANQCESMNECIKKPDTVIKYEDEKDNFYIKEEINEELIIKEDPYSPGDKLEDFFLKMGKCATSDATNQNGIHSCLQTPSKNYFELGNNSTEELDVSEDNYSTSHASTSVEEMEQNERQMLALDKMTKNKERTDSSGHFNELKSIEILRIKSVPISDSTDTSRKIFFCIFCKKNVCRFGRHLLSSHKTESKVINILRLSPKHAKRQQLITELRNEGASFYNNSNEYNKGDLIVTRRPNKNKKRAVRDYTPCPKCKAYYIKRNLKRHSKLCSM